MRALLALLLLSTLALGACDSDPVEEEMPPPEEELLPVTFEYYANATITDLSDFGIRHTGLEGEEVVVTTAAPFAFPFVETVGPLALEARGANGIRFFGFSSSGDAVVARVRAFRDGLEVAEALVTVTPEADGSFEAEAVLVIGPDGQIEED